MDKYFSAIPREIFTLDCFIGPHFDSSDKLFLAKNILTFFEPIGLVILCFFLGTLFKEPILFLKKKFEFEHKKISKSDFRAFFQTKRILRRWRFYFFTLWVVVVYNAYSRILLKTFKILKCIVLDESGAVYLEDEPNILCWSSNEHLMLIVTSFIPNLFFWCCLWPLLLVLILRKNSRKLDRKKVTISMLKQNSPETLDDSNFEIYIRRKHKIFKFLTMDYKPKFYWWEFFFYFVNFTLSAFVVGTSRLDPLSQGATLIATFMLLMIITEAKHPFLHSDINRTQVSYSYEERGFIIFLMK